MEHTTKTQLKKHYTVSNLIPRNLYDYVSIRRYLLQLSKKVTVYFENYHTNLHYTTKNEAI